MIVKPVNAQFDFNLQGYSNDMVFKTNNTERLRLKANGGIIMPNLPTSDPVVAGQLWVNAANKIPSTMHRFSYGNVHHGPVFIHRLEV